MGGAQAIAALAFGTESVRAVDVIVGPGNAVRAGGQAPAGRPRRASTASRARASCSSSLAGAGARPASWSRSTCSPRPSTGRTRWSRPVADDRRCSTPSPSDLERSRPAPVGGRRRGRGGRRGRPRRRARVRRGVRARAPPARRRRGRGARAARAQRRLRVRRRMPAATAFGDYVAGSNHVLPTGGAARFASALGRRATSGAAWPRCTSATARGRSWRPPARRSRAPRASSCTRSRWRPRDRAGEWGVMTAAPPRSTRNTKETERPALRSAWTARAPASARTASASSTTCSTCSPATAGSTSTCRCTGDLETGAHHTVEDTGIVLGQALDQALGDRAGIAPLRPRDRADGRGARDLRDRHLRPPAAASWSADLAARCRSRGFDHELAEEFFRAVADAGEADAAHRRRGGHERPPHDRGGVQGVRPRAARRRSRSTRPRPGVPRTKGTLDRMSPRLAIVDYGMGNRRSVEKALEHVGADPVITSDHDATAGRRRARRARRRRVPARDGATCASWASTSCCASASPRACPCSASAWGCSCCSTPPTSSAAPPGLGLLPGRVAQLDADGPKLPHIGWNLVTLPARRRR